MLEEIRATLAGQNGSDDEASSDEESEDEEESDEEDEEEAEDGEAAEDHSAIKAALLASCLAKFEAAEGRPPTSDERAGLERTIDAKLAPENDAEGEALVVAKVVAHFTSVRACRAGPGRGVGSFARTQHANAAKSHRRRTSSRSSVATRPTIRPRARCRRALGRSARHPAAAPRPRPPTAPRFALGISPPRRGRDPAPDGGTAPETTRSSPPSAGTTRPSRRR